MEKSDGYKRVCTAYFDYAVKSEADFQREKGLKVKVRGIPYSCIHSRTGIGTAWEISVKPK